MFTKFNPSDAEKGDGTTSFASWSSPDMKKVMEQLFGIRPNERIATIEITADGITARIKTEYTSVTDRINAG